jgi:hypothetical protein
MSDLGDARTPLFLARLALLLMKEVGDPERVRTAIDSARRGLDAPVEQSG